ncbi:FadR/GntR family transcriptional regulator [Streptomyces odontomachi]|uniref:FadR/GntR family transcriptional regulator n=1 Tax=Streptomyces odontomachi TaxID=2944940 RepID=UPI0021093902|nr:FadR/GntR family transcriptional regulator [Streptomyces sp. ODS25]
MVLYAGRGVHGQVVESLGYRIVSGAVREGVTLDPRALGEELEVSLTVIREALKVLASKGLLAARQKRGTFVLSRADWNMLDSDVIRWRVAGGQGESLLRDLAEVRAIVEPAAVRCAALRRSEDDLAVLESTLQDMAAAGDDAHAAVTADTAFHRRLLAASGNEMLTALHQLMEPALQARDSIVHTTHAHTGDPVPSHRAVLDAIRDGDADRAAEAMVGLLAKASADFDLAVRSGPPADATTAPPAAPAPTS